MAPGKISGRTWLFDEANINTDLIMPGKTFRMPLDEQVKHVFSANRPGWSDMVEKGDIIVGGSNFGTGSARPAPWLLRHLGVAAIVAESFSDLFLRNCVNYAMPSLVCPGVSLAVREGDVIDVDLAEGRVDVQRSGETLRGQQVPPLLQDIVEAGGLMARLAKEGYLLAPEAGSVNGRAVALPLRAAPIGRRPIVARLDG
jgi:3-isopropylmalate/(R)-2-methylmalate dehydratase small subunit